MGKVFLMRWNPAISSYKLDVYHRNCKDFPDGFRMDWSVWDYQEAHSGDSFVMMRVGEYKPGVVFYGTFVSDPYTDDDWAGTDKKRHYVLMDCFGFKADDEPIICAESLHTCMPEIDWMHGHSGEVLPEKVADQLVIELQKQIENFSYTPYSAADQNDGLGGAGMLPVIMERYASLNPSIHAKYEEGFDWLESDADWSRCLLIPNPNTGGQDIEVETQGEFILYFAGAHGHYENDSEEFEALIHTIDNIINNRECAYSCEYEGWAWSGGMSTVDPTEPGVKEFLREDDEYFIRMLAEYTEKEVRSDGIITIKLRFFDPKKDKTFRFALSELSDKVEQYRARQIEVEKKWEDFCKTEERKDH